VTTAPLNDEFDHIEYDEWLGLDENAKIIGMVSAVENKEIELLKQLPAPYHRFVDLFGTPLQRSMILILRTNTNTNKATFIYVARSRNLLS